MSKKQETLNLTAPLGEIVRSHIEAIIVASYNHLELGKDVATTATGKIRVADPGTFDERDLGLNELQAFAQKLEKFVENEFNQRFKFVTAMTGGFSMPYVIITTDQLGLTQNFKVDLDLNVDLIEATSQHLRC